MIQILVIFSLFFQIPILDQKDVKINGIVTYYACVPTSAAMVTAYWNYQGFPYLSPQYLAEENYKEGEFNPYGGMYLEQLQDELLRNGYNSKLIGVANINSIRKYIKKGPVIAVIPMRLRRGGNPHSVVVTNITDTTITYIDSWTVKEETHTITEFDNNWLRSIFIIRPQPQLKRLIKYDLP